MEEGIIMRHWSPEGDYPDGATRYVSGHNSGCDAPCCAAKREQERNHLAGHGVDESLLQEIVDETVARRLEMHDEQIRSAFGIPDHQLAHLSGTGTLTATALEGTVSKHVRREQQLADALGVEDLSAAAGMVARFDPPLPPEKCLFTPEKAKDDKPDLDECERKAEQSVLSDERVLAGEVLDYLDREHSSYSTSSTGRPWHKAWAEARREYVTTGDTDSLTRMAEYVTMANPPLAGPRPVQRDRYREELSARQRSMLQQHHKQHQRVWHDIDGRPHYADRQAHKAWAEARRALAVVAVALVFAAVGVMLLQVLGSLL